MTETADESHRQDVLVMGLGRGLALCRASAASGRLRLAGAIDPDPARRESAAAQGVPPDRLFRTFEEALKSTPADILVVATPSHLHVEHVLHGLRAGLHVLCEKPLTTRREDALRLRDESRRTGQQLAVIQNARYAPQFRRCRELLREGVIGRLHGAHMVFRRCRPVGGIAHPHAVLLNHGVHHIDVLRYVTGAEPKWIQAIEWDPPEGPVGKGAVLRLTAFTTEGYAVCYDASYAEAGGQTPHTGELRLAGSRGTLEALGEVERPRVRLSRNERACRQSSAEQISVAPGSWDAIDIGVLEGFAEAIEAGGRAETDIDDNLQTLEWLFRAAEYVGTPT